jgi:hypothetical protein
MFGQKIRVCWNEEVTLDNESYSRFKAETSDTLKTNNREDIENFKKWMNKTLDNIPVETRKISGFNFYTTS